ncbi:MAG: carbohydrate ABC transporter permease, partial [Lachnospiraceae bacterium]|nr:carbohydrate ABC transporter permease [Lachnospiraceae bacterium]
MRKKVNYTKMFFKAIVWAVVIILTLSCLLPLINMLAISLSGSDAVAANEVGFIPKDFTVVTYKKLLEDSQFWKSFLISVERVILGLIILMFFKVSMAYPLSKRKKRFPA